MLTQRGDTATSDSNPFADAVCSGRTLCVVTGFSNFISYDLLTLNRNYTLTTSSGLTAQGVTLANAATAIIVYNSANVDFINIASGQRTNITTGTASVFSTTYGQQVAGNTNTGFAMATKSGGLTFINSLTQAATGINPSGIFSSQNPSVITVRPTTNTWLIGSTLGQVYEVNANGTLLQTLNLPVTPNNGTAATTRVTGISYSTPNMTCTTDRGDLYVYNWTTQTLLYRTTCSNWNNSAGGLMCTGASGITLIGKGAAPNNVGSSVTEFYFETADPGYGIPFYNDSNASMRTLGFDPVFNIAWVLYNTISFIQLRTYNMTPTAKVNVDSRFQDPPGTDVSARIIRLRNEGIGNLFIENDTNITGLTSISAADGHNYIEIGIEGGTKFDIREFTA